ncbi:uncharacterized protein RHOBADRAFT_44726 [Rhodotorula graminis WP1]|uniref:T6SS Phospholipase effector Tle1-like catalytic domain-containing protein n=1 Tax=Rhodotorula graminis (strain WP1) TaxID=578459 RepID=A0A194S496_RHOGW|nr:uncharacterized protein RHOBADRAFT_44726 [Rhodotorula graminis WP1]KPV74241.1 hypothetical protein RHOBADRAFT_44726 [Rhodotorula graminis WP1]
MGNSTTSHSPPLLSPPPPPFERRSSYTRGCCESLPRSASTRRLILCFDGTSNTFGLGGITNLPVLFSIASADPAKQLLYYQVGVGQSISAHESTFAPGRMRDRVLAVLDEAIAYSIGQHICGGYRFLMDHWKPGDEIFLFGFSRGAYTARALAGMLQQVGLLPAGNEDTIPLAFSIYKRKANTMLVPGVETLAQGFKRTFSRDVEVHFVGVWDTVASVGALVPRTLPFASGASYIHVFRHALALDEARTRYMPQPWMPYPDFVPNASCSDVKEVWFSGAHSNVGGGEFTYDGGRTPALAHLSLRWMVREAVEAGFEVDSARVLDSPLYEPLIGRAHEALADRVRGGGESAALERFLERATRRNPSLNLHVATVVFLASTISPESTAAALAPRAHHTSFKLQHPPAHGPGTAEGGKLAGWGTRFGARSMTAFWWLLEVSPSVKVVWDPEGNTRRWTIRANNGRGRQLPPDPVLHFSVLQRVTANPSIFPAGGNNENYPEGNRYTIKADFVQGQGPLTARIEL